MGLVGPQSSTIQVAAVNCQRHFHEQQRQSNVRNVPTYNGQGSQSDFCVGLALPDLWYWLINHGVFRHEEIRSLLHFYLICISIKILKQPTGCPKKPSLPWSQVLLTPLSRTAAALSPRPSNSLSFSLAALDHRHAQPCRRCGGHPFRGHHQGLGEEESHGGDREWKSCTCQ